MKNQEKINSLITELREIARECAVSQGNTSDNDLTSVSNINEMYDLDIFFSRKPGMKSSIQIIQSSAPNKEATRLSCLTAIFSLCDTLVNQKDLNVSEDDIIAGFGSWAQFHGLLNEDSE